MSFALEKNLRTQQEIEDKMKEFHFQEATLLRIAEVSPLGFVGKRPRKYFLWLQGHFVRNCLLHVVSFHTQQDARLTSGAAALGTVFPEVLSCPGCFLPFLPAVFRAACGYKAAGGPAVLGVGAGPWRNAHAFPSLGVFGCLYLEVISPELRFI